MEITLALEGQRSRFQVPGNSLVVSLRINYTKMDQNSFAVAAPRSSSLGFCTENLQTVVDLLDSGASTLKTPSFY